MVVSLLAIGACSPLPFGRSTATSEESLVVEKYSKTYFYTPGARYGSSVACLGDVDQDGTADLGLTAPKEDGGDGVVAFFYLTSSGTYSGTPSSMGPADLGMATGAGAGLGWALASLGDVNGDGVQDFAVASIGSPAVSSACPYPEGAVHLVHATTAGAVLNFSTIAGASFGLEAGAKFGRGLAALGSVEATSGSGGSSSSQKPIRYLAVGAPGAPGGGCVYVLPANWTTPAAAEAGGGGSKHSMVSMACAADLAAAWATGLAPSAPDPAELSSLGHALAWVPPANDAAELHKHSLLLAGCPNATSSGPGGGAVRAGAVWLLNLTTTAAAAASAAAAGGAFLPIVSGGVRLDTSGLGLRAGDRFGSSVAVLSTGIGGTDVDQSFYTLDLAVGAPGDDTQGPDGGCVWLLSVEPDSGLVRWSAKVSSLAGIPLATGTEVAIGKGDNFGESVACLGDVTGDGKMELAAGVPGYNTTAASNGAGCWLTLFLRRVVLPTFSPTVPPPTGVPSPSPTPADTVRVTVNLQLRAQAQADVGEPNVKPHLESVLGPQVAIGSYSVESFCGPAPAPACQTTSASSSSSSSSSAAATSAHAPPAPAAALAATAAVPGPRLSQTLGRGLLTSRDLLTSRGLLASRGLISRGLSSSGEATVAFSASASLAAMGLTGAGAFEASVEASLQSSIADGSLGAAVSASYGCAVTATGVATALGRNYPSLGPTPQPTSEPSLLPTPLPTASPSRSPTPQPSKPLPTPPPTHAPTTRPSAYRQEDFLQSGGFYVLVILALGCVVAPLLRLGMLIRQRGLPDAPALTPALTPAAPRPPPESQLTPEDIRERTSLRTAQHPAEQFASVKSRLRSSGKEVDSSCAICLEDLAEKGLVRDLASCHHCYHVECIDEWLARSDLCPLCKVSVVAPPARGFFRFLRMGPRAGGTRPSVGQAARPAARPGSGASATAVRGEATAAPATGLSRASSGVRARGDTPGVQNNPLRGGLLL